MVPELPMSLLACARIGAVHSVVFGGFSADSCANRINDAEAKVLITGDGAWRRGQIVPLKEVADEALAETPSIEQVVVLRRTEQDVPMTEGRDVWWHDVVPQQSAECEPEADGLGGPPLPPLHVGHHREAEGHHAHDRRVPDAGRVHAQGGVRSPSRHRRVLVRGRRRLGHRPLLHRVRPSREPGDERHVRGRARLPRQGPALVDHRQVRRDDPLHRTHCHPHLHEVGHGVPRASRPVVAEAPRVRRRADQPEAWVWYWQNIGGGHCPVVDTWWQTETGAIM
jgi:acetyl-CoA synthetase